MTTEKVQSRSFIVLLIAVSLAFFAIIAPFFSPILWAAIFAIMFMPLQNRVRARMPRRPTLASLLTLVVCIVVAIIPLLTMALALLQEGRVLFELIQSGKLDFGRYVDRIQEAAPSLRQHAADLGINVVEVREGIRNTVSSSSAYLARNAVNIGQFSFGFIVKFGVMLYLLFFFLRDGHQLARRISDAVPLSEEHKTRLFRKFGEVVRATMKGNVLIALIQGALGGFIFWILDIQGALLWGALMALLSLLPAVGAALIWTPVAVYFLLTGQLWQGILLVAFGVGPIGLADNLLRPRLVGQKTQLPDYAILVTTLGGITLLGISGFVLGPLVAAFFIAVWDLSLNEFRDPSPAATLPPEAESQPEAALTPPAPTTPDVSALPPDA
ncbi:AI-2E family transporter [Isoalcanivorax beigongshangi]|uniref:AI-2E family transporter n=1 Tax=Isoalcanivorax beigongshangi TaxID=3238810 RepID=A0ABV4AM37_9GAMM